MTDCPTYEPEARESGRHAARCARARRARDRRACRRKPIRRGRSSELLSLADDRQQALGLPAVRHTRCARTRSSAPAATPRSCALRGTDKAHRAQDRLQRPLRATSTRASAGTIAVAEAARNVACAGGRPMAITNNLNFGNPKQPGGLLPAARGRRRHGRGVPRAAARRSPAATSRSTTRTRPARSIRRRSSAWWASSSRSRTSPAPRSARAGDAIVLLGDNTDEIGGSEYLAARSRRRRRRAAARATSTASARSSTRCSRRSRAAHVRSAHDCSDGGLAVALAECVHGGPRDDRTGADVDLSRVGRAAAARAAVRRGAGPRRRLDAATPHAVLDDRGAARRAGARHRHACASAHGARLARAAIGARRARDVARQLAEAYHDAIPRHHAAPAAASRAGRRRSPSDAVDLIRCAASSASAATPTRRRSPSSASTRSSIAGRSRPASSAVDVAGDARAVEAWGSCPTGSATASSTRCTATLAIGHTRYSTAGSSTHRERAAGARALARRAHRARAQRQPHQRRASCASSWRSGARSSQSSMDSRGRSCTASRARTADTPERRVADALQRRRGRVLPAHRHRRHARRGARPARLAPARAWARSDGAPVFASETCALDIVGATYVRDVAARRDRRRRRRGRAHRSFPLPSAGAAKRCVFEHVYFARPDSRIFGGSVDRARRALGRQLARECPAPGAELVFSVPDSSNSAALGFAEESRAALRARAHPQPLRGPHVHPADAGDARREGEGEVQRRARGARRARAS